MTLALEVDVFWIFNGHAPKNSRQTPKNPGVRPPKPKKKKFEIEGSQRKANWQPKGKLKDSCRCFASSLFPVGFTVVLQQSCTAVSAVFS